MAKQKYTSKQLTGEGNVIKLNDVEYVDFKTDTFDGVWGQIWHEPFYPMYLLIWGKKGSGKSTFVVAFCKYLAQKKGKKILYISHEEKGVKGTFHKKVRTVNAFVDNFNVVYYKTVSNLTNSKILKDFDVVVFDSISSIKMTEEEFTTLTDKYPQLSVIGIQHATKQGTDKGSSFFGHMVDAMHQVMKDDNNNIYLISDKNRYGGEEKVYIGFLDYQPEKK